MNLIIDANIFSKFFDTNHPNHKDFTSAYNCLFNCKGKMFTGGTTFKKELESNLKKYSGYLKELKNKRKLEILDMDKVDAEEARIKELEPDKDFDDPHIIACVIIGKVKVICSDDARADTYVKDSKFYPKRFIRPKIYRKHKHHKDLLIDCW